MRKLTVVLLAVVAAAANDTAPRLYTEIPDIANGQTVIWHDPGAVAQLDFRYGIGGEENAPKPPFSFVKEDLSGTSPKVTVHDASGRTWVVKFGSEASPDTFATRMVWAVGYWVESNYFVADGVIAGANHLTRARREVDEGGNFHNGRFQLRSDSPKYLNNIDWKWDGNPFLGTRELNGLRVMMMVLSNWDDKDYRDAASRGGNTAIYKDGDRYIFFIDDWGGSMGNWGKLLTRSKWNCMDYFRQSKNFVKSMQPGSVDWGYTGQHTRLITAGVRPADVKWLMQYLGKITDEQIHTGLMASGASEEEAGYCGRGIRMRIQQLATVGDSPGLSTDPKN